ncbi:lytic transglycosylase domain-containing protein [Mucilaginibacter myungsuensis]|uniref:Lytic transglycosylase domain-containing protein n=1 Tax=Mucilaginibacter myungsuensis TaxID=649104 RepID=A0A929KW18_9SPHI|nr:lytic transglycosylase domain-containing protein [Mucilaginibacter myungsuensis]MBE9661510.1 lytic transglycosylase domain-containing protein [Mucilaginibacter myungsuensis]MDN3597653.1 lytic transglycosylase domain-containing protein [Mucilaginibacter myungsuensis]
MSVTTSGTAVAPKFSPLVSYNNNANTEINFADENLPVKIKRVKTKFQHSVKQHSYNRIGSSLLHRKAATLFPIIEPILKAYGIPEDFKYIPLVESGLKAGTSPRGARGLWQFMPGTARSYGLRVHGKVDERLNLRKSTIAACVYLRELYSEFDSWTLTAAAYNLGSVKLQRAINKSDRRNYYLMHLNAETGNYVYKLLAMKQVISKPEQNGYEKNSYAWLKPNEVLLACIN